MLGIVLVVSATVVVANLAADLAYARADPRVQLG
jgi:ABC-type dipeptide/oligopeptide/nickel transport system permease component